MAVGNAFEVLSMKKTIYSILSYVLVAAVSAVTVLALCMFHQRQDKLDAMQAVIDHYFIGDADEDKIQDAAASAMVEALGDEWSYYMNAEQYKAYQEAMSNTYVGVGITIQLRENQQGYDITEVVPGGPADEAGIKAGDVLIGAGGESLIGDDVREPGELIRGEEGTKVELKVLRDDKELSFTATRHKLETPVATYQMLPDNIGLVTIENFDQRCAQETIAAIEALRKQGATALIFDVRNNPGGYKNEMVKVLDYLLPEGDLFRSVDYRGKEEVIRSKADHLDMPMAVLMNLRSYSAAEFFAAVLREYDAAVTVGEKTYGKGYFQTAIELSDGSAVNLSIGKYYTPKGESLVGKGLSPDVEVVVDEETAAKIYAGILEPAEDPQIIAAINALKNGK